MYLKSNGETEESTKWLEASSKQDYIPAIHQLAAHLLQLGDKKKSKEAMDLLHFCAKQEYTDSKLKLIEVFSTEGPEKDEKKAQEMILMCAFEGIPEAEYLLGLYHFNTDDHDEAYKWFLQASRKGHLKSIFNLGMFYIDGIGVPADREKGWSIIKKAADRGDPDSIRFLQKFNEENKD